VEVLEGGNPAATITLATVIRGIRACQEWETLKRIVGLEINADAEAAMDEERSGRGNREVTSSIRAEGWEPRDGQGEMSGNASGQEERRQGGRPKRQSVTAGNAKAEATHSGGGGLPEQRRQPPGDGERTSSTHEGERHRREEGQELTGWKRTQEQEPTHPRRIPDKRKRKTGEHRRSGWATLNEQGLEEVELRDTPDFGGDGHRGVFVREGYVLEKNYRLPYFGRTVADDANQHGNNVFLSALPGRKDCVLNGDPEALARERPDLAPGTWAGAYINHARSRDEENCQMVMLPSRSRRIATELYQGATPEPVKVCFQVTKSVRGGQQLLAAYG
jgi:hypothetical protein